MSDLNLTTIRKRIAEIIKKPCINQDTAIIMNQMEDLLKVVYLDTDGHLLNCPKGPCICIPTATLLNNLYKEALRQSIVDVGEVNASLFALREEVKRNIDLRLSKNSSDGSLLVYQNVVATMIVDERTGHLSVCDRETSQSRCMCVNSRLTLHSISAQMSNE